MLRSRVALIVLLLVGALLTPFAPVQASSTLLCTGYSSCSSKGYSSYGYSTHKSTSYWRMYAGTNCTNYVAYRLVSTNGMPNTRPHSGDGNAEDWGTTESKITDKKPVVGSVAWWGRTGHHVAYVEQVVSSTEIVVSESNWSGEFDWRRITSSSGWPDGYIHFADLKLKNTAKPKVSGVVKVGTTLKASSGTWSPSGAKYAYQWLVDGATLKGATATTYTPTAGQEGHTIAVKVTASKTSYPTSSVSTSPVKIAPGALTSVTAPTITGTARVDETLTIAPGSASPAPVTYSYQWLVNGTAVAGASSTTYTPGPEAVGKPVSVRVTASKPGYTDLSTTSAATAPVAPGLLTNTAAPTISGKPTVGEKLTAHPGSWSKPGLEYAYQWFVDDHPVSGATSATYVPVASDYARPVSVRVTASKPGYAPKTVQTSPTKDVQHGVLSMTKGPTVSGTVRVGTRLTASPGAWSPAVVLTYQWYAGTTKITGAKQASFVPTVAQLGQKLQVRVIARRAGYLPGDVRSPMTVTVAHGVVWFSAPPRITGTTRVGSRLKVYLGSYHPKGATLHYQWLRNGKPIATSVKSSRFLTEHDKHAKLSVRLTYSASGYTTRTVHTSTVGPIKASLS